MPSRQPKRKLMIRRSSGTGSHSSYGHVAPILELMAKKLGKTKEDLKIYDP